MQTQEFRLLKFRGAYSIKTRRQYPAGYAWYVWYAMHACYALYAMLAMLGMLGMLCITCRQVQPLGGMMAVG